MQYGGVNGSVNWSLAPSPVAAFLQQYSVDNISVMNVKQDWGGFKFEFSKSEGDSSTTWGVQTNFSSFDTYSYDSSPFFKARIIGGFVEPPYVDAESRVWVGGGLTAGLFLSGVRLSAFLDPGSPALGDTASERAWVNIDPNNLAPSTATTATYVGGQSFGQYATSRSIESYVSAVYAPQRAEGLVNYGWVSNSTGITAFRSSASSSDEPGGFRGLINNLYDNYYVRYLGARRNHLADDAEPAPQIDPARRSRMVGDARGPAQAIPDVLQGRAAGRRCDLGTGRRSRGEADRRGRQAVDRGGMEERRQHARSRCRRAVWGGSGYAGAGGFDARGDLEMIEPTHRFVVIRVAVCSIFSLRASSWRALMLSTRSLSYWQNNPHEFVLVAGS